MDNGATESLTYRGEPVFTVVEEIPEFPGGIQALYKYLGKNIKYPAAAAKANVSGKVFLRFVVTKEGEAKDISIIKGIGFGADEEALRVVSSMPRWRPGMQDSKAVNVLYNLPIAFELDKATGNSTADGPAQEETALTYNGEPVFTVVQKQPQFPGGIQAMYKFLGENIKYPEAAVKAKVQGKVFLRFVVTKEGEIKDIDILKGMGFGTEEEAIRVLSKMPRWTPGQQDGNAINVRFNLPIAFELDGKPELKKSEEAKKVGMQGVSPDSEIERVTGSKPTRLEDSEQMLLVVDGKIMSDRSEKPELDPAAVESINIMKDAAAIKKYGDQGKNGAIEIILKKG